MRDAWRQTTLGAFLTEIARPVVVAALGEVRYAGVRWYTEGVYAREPVPASGVKTKTLTELRQGDVTYNRMWATKASFGVAGEDVDGCHVTNDFPIFEVDTSQASGALVKLLFETSGFQAEAASRATGTTERRRLKQRDFLAIPITLPPLDEQRRIVDLIAAVDDAVDAAEAEAEAEQRTLTDIGLVANERVAAGEWPTVTLAQALGSGSIMTGPFGSALHQEDYREAGTPVVMPKNIVGHRVNYDGIARIGDEDVERLLRYQTRAGDILWSRRGDVTRFAVIGDADAGSICGTGCFIVRPGDSKVTPWLEMWLATPLVKKWLTERAVGATMANLNTSLLGGAPVADVPDEERGALIASIGGLRGAADAARATADALRTLRSNLLTVLLSGKHEIPSSYDALLGEVA